MAAKHRASIGQIPVTRPPRMPYGFVSWTGAARLLSRAFTTNITRQRVERWHRRKNTTGFNAVHPIYSNGHVVPGINVEELFLWYRDYQPYRRRDDRAD